MLGRAGWLGCGLVAVACACQWPAREHRRASSSGAAVATPGPSVAADAGTSGAGDAVLPPGAVGETAPPAEADALPDPARLKEELLARRRDLLAAAKGAIARRLWDALPRIAADAAASASAVPGWRPVDPVVLADAMREVAFAATVCRAAGEEGEAVCDEADSLEPRGGERCRAVRRVLEAWRRLRERSAVDDVFAAAGPGFPFGAEPLRQAVVSRSEAACDRLGGPGGMGEWTVAFCRAVARRDPEPCAVIADARRQRMCRALVLTMPGGEVPLADPDERMVGMFRLVVEGQAPPEACANAAVGVLALHPDVVAAYDPGKP